jgi:hypothetical protein
VVIIGISNETEGTKTIYENGIKRSVKKINLYLTDGISVTVNRRSRPLSFSNEMSFGNMPNDGGGLILTEEERKELLTSHPVAKKFVRKFLGALEFIRGYQRFCLWIENSDREQAESIPFIKSRIEISKNHRLKSKDKGTRLLSNRPHQFRDRKVALRNQIIVPRVSSERREYIPCDFLVPETVIADSAQVIYDPETWLLGVLCSKMHMVWVKAVGGRLKTDFRYAKDLIYNTFPFPEISDNRKNEITQCVFRILEEREKYPEKTLAELYDPDKMPAGLRAAHHANDEVIERCYRSKPFESDEERLEYLFKLYEKMVEEEKTKGSLFENKKEKKKANN